MSAQGVALGQESDRSHFCPFLRPEGAQHVSPGRSPGIRGGPIFTISPEGAQHGSPGRSPGPKGHRTLAQGEALGAQGAPSPSWAIPTRWGYVSYGICLLKGTGGIVIVFRPFRAQILCGWASRPGAAPRAMIFRPSGACILELGLGPGAAPRAMMFRPSGATAPDAPSRPTR